MNDINVFPVPDGDTGTNMAMTMESIAEGAQDCGDSSLDTVSDAIAESAIQGARGNSGVILAQFFQGLTENFKGKLRISTKSFAHAANVAVDKAKDAISNPREGTIITVMRDWADYVAEHAPHKHDFAELLSSSLVKAKQSLADTPKKLKVLEKAGVVDSGAEGFVHMIEGMVDFINTGKIAAMGVRHKVVDKIRHISHDSHAKSEFRFCTECLLVGKDMNKNLIRENLLNQGDSLIVIGSLKKVRVHIHTNNPDKVFETLSPFGKLQKKKVDDMHSQMDDQIEKTGIALVTDSTCDLPQETLDKYNVQVIPVRIHVGEKSYLDRVEMSSADFYQIMKSSDSKLSTSLPSPGSYKQVYGDISKRYESMISIHLASALSGTFNSARVAAKDFAQQLKYDMVDARTTSAALGLIVNEAGQLIQQGAKHEEIVDRIKDAIRNTRIFISIPTLKYLIRSGRVNWAKGFIGSAINMKPLLTVDAQGHAVELAKVFGKRNLVKKTLSLATQFGQSVKNPKIGIVHVLAPQVANQFKQHLEGIFQNQEIFITDASPALGVHTGIGSVAIAVMGGSNKN